jgi:large subunit ribosomal protein L24
MPAVNKTVSPKLKMRIKKGDQVIVLSGRDKGRTGTVTQSMPKDGKVIVGGINVATRHKKPTQADPQGGLEKIEAPMHVSKVAHVTADGKPTRVRYEVQDGKKVRVAVKTGVKIDG